MEQQGTISRAGVTTHITPGKTKTNPTPSAPTLPAQLTVRQAKGRRGKPTIQLKQPAVNQESQHQSTRLPQASSSSIQSGPGMQHERRRPRTKSRIHPWLEPELAVHLLQNPEENSPLQDYPPLTRWGTA